MSNHETVEHRPVSFAVSIDALTSAEVARRIESVSMPTGEAELRALAPTTHGGALRVSWVGMGKVHLVGPLSIVGHDGEKV